MNSDDLKLSRRIQNLVPWLVMLTLALLVLVPAPAGAVDKFVIGDRVEVSAATANARDAPAGTIIGSHPQGALGTVVDGPALAGVTWWRIDYDTGADGWTGEDRLTKFVGPEPPPPPQPQPPDKFVIGDRVEVSPADGIGATGVRDTPGGTLIGDQPLGALGTVLDGPRVAGVNNGAKIPWWQINYDSGTDGWSPEENLTKVVDPLRADLAISLTDTPDPLTVNGQLTYTITVENNGPGTATDVQVVDSLPPGATVLVGPASSSQGECRGNTVTVVCDLGTLAAGAEAPVTINVIPTVTGDLSNAAHLTAFQTDPNPANNSSTETTTVRAPPDPALAADLAVTAVAEDINPTASGQGFTYRLTVKNDGPNTATGVQLTNDLPRGIALGPPTASQSQANCTDTDPMLCTLGTLTSGTEATVAIDVIRTEGVTLPNRAAVNGDQHDPNTDNNKALTSALDLPTPRTTCNSTRCKLRLTCNLSGLLEGGRCDNQVTLFVDTRARRLSDERAARQPRRLVRFAAAVRNFPGGQTENVPLKLTPKGKKLSRTLMRRGKRKITGVMEIRNHVGGMGIDRIRLTVRLK